MNALVARADAIQPFKKRRKLSGDVQHKRIRHSQTPKTDETLNSVAKHTTLPKSLRDADPLPDNSAKHAHIKNIKLRSELTRQSAHAARSKALLKDAELLLIEDAGKIEVEGEMEKTWRIGQNEIATSAGQEAAKGRREWKLESGSYKSRYSRNGRFVKFSALLPPLEFQLEFVYTGISLWLERPGTSLHLIGRRVRCMPNYSYKRHVEI
jgi:U3 small nucleolar RNA-associated protein 7